MELKSPSRENTDVSEAYRQLRNYMREIPSMFIYNAICVMSDHLTSKAGTITSGEDRFMEWKTKESARAKMRMLIKRLLKRHKYPPEGVEDAVKTVMLQCELWTDNIMQIDE